MMSDCGVSLLATARDLDITYFEVLLTIEVLGSTNTSSVLIRVQATHKAPFSSSHAPDDEIIDC